MIPVKTPIPPYATTDGTYWPDGKGTIPLPVDFPNDGSTYVVVTVSNATAGDSLDTLVFAGIDLLGGAVPMVNADDDQSVDDIVTQIDTNTAGSFTGAAAVNGVSVVYRVDLGETGSVGPLTYTATTGAGSVITIVATRIVIGEADTFPTDRYYIMDALDPGVNTLDPEFVAPTFLPTAGPSRTWSWQSIVTGMWIYAPLSHTLHKITRLQMMGGSGLSTTFGTHLFVVLDPPLPATIADPVPIRLMMGTVSGLRIENVGGVDGLLDGHNFPSLSVFDRSIAPQMLQNPLTYDSSGTEYTIVTNS